MLVGMSIRQRFRHIVLLVALPAWACSSEDVSRETFENEGELCMRSLADGSLLVSVAFPTCLSSSCSQALEASCSVEVDGARVVIQSRGSAEHRGRECTADCGTLGAECMSEELEPGQYEVVHGDTSYQVMLPAASISLPDEGSWRCPD